MTTPSPSSPGSPPSGSTVSPDSGQTFLGHPPGLFLLFLVEMWERFSYYGMRALLVLYLISVIAVHQLPGGTYTNTLTFSQLPDAAASKQAALEAAAKGTAPSEPKPIGVVTRPLTVVVGDQASISTAEASTEQAPQFVLTRLTRSTATPAEGESEPAWVARPDGGDTAVILRGAPGAKGRFTDSEVAWSLSNPTDQAIRVKVELRPHAEKGSPANGRTFFTINDSSASQVLELKPKGEPTNVIIKANEHDSGRNWSKADASVLYGWYTGLAYLFPILGGLIADKLIGTHRSMLVGGLLITLGHVILGVSGLGALAQNATGMSLFIMGLAVIVLGTGHFKPTVSVMVGQLYKEGDPRRDGAFTIFYMGINLGAFICAFVCGTLGEKVGWHYGFGSAAVGMILGLALYVFGKPAFLRGIGEPPAEKRAAANSMALGFLVLGTMLAAGFAGLYHFGAMASLQAGIGAIQQKPVLSVTLIVGLLAALGGWVVWFLKQNRPEDRGPVITIFVYMFFNAMFWIAFEQAGTSINVFTEQKTDRMLFGFEVPATWFQSINAGLIFMLAPLFAALWTRLGRRNLNPGQPIKIALGLLFVGLGYIFMVIAANHVQSAAKASMMLIVMTYFWHTVGELCLSPTGLSYVTKAAPVRFVSLLMGIWFISSFIANLGGGLVAAQVEAIEKGEAQTFLQNFGIKLGGQADFFLLFVATSGLAGVIILGLSPLLLRLQRSRHD
jgi:proton-dependent oligopeptide transporter, POT family